MALQLEDKRRQYQRIRLNTNEKQELIDKGLTPVLSSNVSAIAKQGAKLIVRFHGGATYEYPRSGRLYARMLNSSSKGKFVWVHLRRTGVPYNKIGSISMDYDKNVKDRDLMQESELKQIHKELLTIKARPNVAKLAEVKARTTVNASVSKTITKKKPTGLVSALALTTVVEPKDMITGIITALVVSDILERSQQSTDNT